MTWTPKQPNQVARLYIAGPMTGLPEFNYPAFAQAERDLDNAGYQHLENPTTGGQVDGWEWSDYIRRGLTQLLQCDGIALLHGWADSSGAALERDLGLQLGMIVQPIDYWLDRPVAPPRPLGRRPKGSIQ